jgi:signal transduction histidine kinase
MIGMRKHDMAESGGREAPADGIPGPARAVMALERLLAIEAASLGEALDRSSSVIAGVLHADTIDVYLYDPGADELVAIGVSDTPMGRRQREVGLDRLPLARGGWQVEVYRAGVPYVNGHIEQDAGALPAFARDLGVRSAMAMPLELAGERRGILGAMTARADAYAEADVSFLAAVARWVALVLQRTETVERHAREALERSRREAEAGLRELERARTEAERTRAAIISSAAHDLKTPLTSIRGYAQLAQRRLRRLPADEVAGVLEYLRHIDTVVGRMVGTLDELVEVTRGELGRALVLDRHVLDLVALLHAVAATQDADAQARIRIDAQEQRLEEEVDAARLERALANLLSNAIKYSPDGAAVEVRITREDAPSGSAAVIAVSDRGMGIPAADLPRIFDLFRRGGNAAGRFPGTGIGLASVRQIVEAHGGTVSVESVEGEGSTFTVRLPLHPRTPESAQAG